MFKKVLLLTLCLVCLLCGCGEQPAQNDTQSDTQNDTSSAALPVGGDFKFWLSDVTCKAGESCQVEIRLSPKSQVAASDLIIEFDADKLSYESFQGGGAFQSEAAEQETGKVKVTSITLNPPEEETLVGTLTLKAKEGANGKTDLKLTSETCANIDLQDMVPVCFGGSVTIE